jgi:hypothetical protein
MKAIVRFMVPFVAMLAGVLVISGLASGASSSSSSRSAALGAATAQAAAYACPAHDNAGFPLGSGSDATGDPLFCSYPAFPSENPFDFFCTYSSTTGALVQDSNGGLCPSNADLVDPVPGQLAALLTAVTGVGAGTSLADKVKRVQGNIAANDNASACGVLADFIKQVKAQDGKSLTNAQAADFTAQADVIRTNLGC